MEDFEFTDPTDDFSLLTLEEIRSIASNHLEIKSVRRNVRSAWIPIPGMPLGDCFYYVIGYGTKSRFLLVALNYDSDIDCFIYHQIKLADEEDIQGLWCG